jgi:hypothetical protein
MQKRLEKIEEKIRAIRQELDGIREMRPGSVSKQYKNREAKTGAYYQLSYTYDMKSCSQYIRPDQVREIRRQTAEYRRFKQLVDLWIELSIEHSQIKIKLSEKDTRNMPSREMMTQTPKEVVLKVTLKDISPPIWRKLRLPTDATLDQLHYAIQGAFGWKNCHLHEFIMIEREMYSSNEINIVEGGHKDSRNFLLDQFISQKIVKFEYHYDFGDSWYHEVDIENVMESPEQILIPECIDGENQCPPENCGGHMGFEDFLEAMKNKKHKRHVELREWYGGRFDPKKFSINNANKEIKSYQKYSG